MKRSHAEITPRPPSPPYISMEDCENEDCFQQAELERESPWVGKVQEACRSGQLETAKRLMAKFVPAKRCSRCPGPNFNNCLREACLGKHADVVAWVLTYLKTMAGFVGAYQIDWEFLVEPDDSVANSAVILEWLWNNAYKPTLQVQINSVTSDVTDFFISFANGCDVLPAMQWFWDLGVVVAQRPTSDESHRSDIYTFAENKDIKTLRWLHHHNCVNLEHAHIRKNGTVNLNPYKHSLRSSRLLISAT